MSLQTAKGVRDFAPEEKILRDKIAGTIKYFFEVYGFSPLETPILERFETLSAKYAGGSEILKETFALTDQGKRKLGLRFDLTVPLARYIGMNPNIKLPFKRYEIGRVFRDGPIRLGRMREFWQCDADIIGVKSMYAEAELLSIAKDVFNKLGINAIIKVNNRKLLNGILDEAGISDKKEEAILSIDKLDKFGIGEVKEELKEKGFKAGQIEKLLEIFAIKGDYGSTIKRLKQIIKSSEGLEGIKEIEELFNYLKLLNVNAELDISLARGLAYYTGTVFEVFQKEGIITSSIAAGGRYDKMISAFLNSKREYPAAGLAFGLEPITEIVKLMKKETIKTKAKIYLIPIKAFEQSMEILKMLRSAGINADIDALERGPSRNLEYANSLGIPYVLFIGQDELKQEKLKLKDMRSGREELLAIKDVIAKMKQ